MRSIFALVSLLATPAFANNVIALSEIPFTPLLFKICFRITALVASSGLSVSNQCCPVKLPRITD